MLNLFAPFAKVNTTEDGGREVWGFATLERKDKSDEIADFEGTLKAFQEWSSEIEKNTQGKSKGNIRVMHQPVTGGTVIDWQPGTTKIEENGQEKEVRGIWVGSYIPPHKADVIADIDAGVLSAYSIGGSYAKKWRDPKENATRFIPKMSELSIVDNPCVPGAEFQVVKYEQAPWENKSKEVEEVLTPEQIAKAAQAAGVPVEQVLNLLTELAKAQTPGGKVDGDGDDDNNKEFPNKDEDAADQSKAKDDAKKDDEGDMSAAAKDDDGGDMGAAAKDDGGEIVEAAAKFVSGIVGEELAKAGATISEATREKLHKAASHIHDTCKCAKCMKAASIYAGENGTNNGEEPQQPPVKKEELVTDLQKAVGFSFAEELGKAGFAKQDDLSKFASDVSELAKSVGSITETLTKVSESVTNVVSQVEAVSKSVKAIEEAPTQGGPLLFGANGQQAQPVQKSAMDMEIDALNKAFEATSDPNLKDVLGRKLAILEHKNNR